MAVAAWLLRTGGAISSVLLFFWNVELAVFSVESVYDDI